MVNKAPTPKVKANEQGGRNSLFALVLFLLGLGLLKYALNPGESEVEIGPDQSITKTKQYEEKVNYHLSHIQTLKDLKEAKIKVDNGKTAPSLSEAKPEDIRVQEENTFEGASESYDDLIGKDLNRGSQVDEKKYLNLTDRINQDLIEKEKQRHQSEFEKEQYIRQFVENARKDGYDVVVDSEGRVKSVKKIKLLESAPTIFGPNSLGGSR